MDKVLSLILNEHKAALSNLNVMQQSAFYSVGFIDQVRQQLVLKVQAYQGASILQFEIVQRIFEELETLKQQKILLDDITEACLVALQLMSSSQKQRFLGLLNRHEFTLLKNKLLEKSLTISGSANSDFLNWANVYGNSDTKAIIYKAIKRAVKQLPDMPEMQEAVNAFEKAAMINSPLMSVYLLLLDPQRMNFVCNYVSQQFTREQAIAVLLQTGATKYVPMAVALLTEVRSAKNLVAGIKRCLGSQLDELVAFDTQIRAGDCKQAAVDFQRQFALSWPEQKINFNDQTLVYGFAMNRPVSVASLQGVDFFSWQVITILNALKYDCQNSQAS